MGAQRLRDVLGGHDVKRPLGCPVCDYLQVALRGANSETGAQGRRHGGAKPLFGGGAGPVSPLRTGVEFWTAQVAPTATKEVRAQIKDKSAKMRLAVRSARAWCRAEEDAKRERGRRELAAREVGGPQVALGGRINTRPTSDRAEQAFERAQRDIEAHDEAHTGQKARRDGHGHCGGALAVAASRGR